MAYDDLNQETIDELYKEINAEAKATEPKKVKRLPKQNKPIVHTYVTSFVNVTRAKRMDDHITHYICYHCRTEMVKNKILLSKDKRVNGVYCPKCDTQLTETDVLRLRNLR